MQPASTPVVVPKPAQVHIQLTAAGLALADGGELQISALGKSFSFSAGVAQSVTVADWTWLQTRRIDGELLFQVAPAPTAVHPSAVASAPSHAPAAGPVAVPPAAHEVTEAPKETNG